MNRVQQISGMSIAFLAVFAAGCGGSSSSPVGTEGTLSGTVTRKLIVVNAPGITEPTIAVPDANSEVEIYQGDVLRQKSPTDGQGHFTVSLPVGRYIVKPSDAILERTPAEIQRQEVTVKAGKTINVELQITIPGL